MPREEAYSLTVSTTRAREFAEVLGAAGARQIQGHAVGWRRGRFPAVLRPRGARCDTGQKPLYDLAFRFPGSRVITSAGPARRTARIRLRISPSGIAPRGRSRPRGAIQPGRGPRRAPRTTATAARSRRVAPAARGRAGCGIRGTARGPTQSVSARQGAPRGGFWAGGP